MNIPVFLERIDLNDLRRRLGNDDELIADLLRMFIESCPEQLAAIRSAIETGHPDAVRRAAHIFKGSAASLSATSIRTAAAALENAGERGDVAEFDRLFAALAHEVDGLATEIGGRS